MFLHGYFENAVIDRLQVYSNGVLAEAKVDTDACDHFLDDLLRWLTTEGGIQFEPTEPASRLYLSQLEVQSDIKLESAFQKLSPLGRQIADILRSYGQGTPDYVPAGFSLGSLYNDTMGFRFEGREGPNAQAGTFFASARLRTSDHLRVLETLTNLLS
jgi:hypothetical protein